MTSPRIAWRRLIFSTIAILLYIPIAVEAASIVSTWSAAASGTWSNSSNWTNDPTQTSFPNNGNPVGSTYDALIAATGSAYTVTINSDIAVEDLSLNSANATVDHTSGAFTASGALTISAGTYRLNGGAIRNTVVNATGGTLAFTVNGLSQLDNVTVTGTMALTATGAKVRVLNGTTINGTANLDAIATEAGTIQIVGGHSATFGPNALVRGRGFIGVNDFNIDLGAKALFNQGTIHADLNGGPLTIQGTFLTNTGVLKASGGGALYVKADTTVPGLGALTNQGGSIKLGGNYDTQVGNTSLNITADPVTLDGGRFFGGGTIDLSAKLIFSSNFDNRLDNVVVTGTMNFAANFAQVRLLNGTVLNATANLDAVYTNAARIVVPAGHSATFGPGALIRGGGDVTGEGLGATTAAVLNQGTIQADRSDGSLTIFGGNFTNAGVLKATSGSILNVRAAMPVSALGTLTNQGGTINLSADFNTQGGSTTLNVTDGAVTLDSGRFLGGGTIHFPAGKLVVAGEPNNRLDNVTVTGTMNFLASSARVRLLNGTVLNATVNLDANASFPAQINIDGNHSATFGPQAIVRGRGIVGGLYHVSGTRTLLNQGTIQADLNGSLLTIDATTFTNAGIVAAVNGASVSVPAGFTQTAGTTRVANNSTITIPSPNVLTLQAGLLTGQGTIAGKVSNAGTIAPGLSAGTLNIANDLSLTPASTLQIEIGGLTQGSQYDLLTEAGGVALNLDGTLNVTLINSFVPTAADTFTVVDSNQTLVGAFDNVANGGRIATTDGFGSFRVNYGSGSAFPSDRVVLSDFALVPEPGSLALLGFSAALFGLRRR